MIRAYLPLYLENRLKAEFGSYRVKLLAGFVLVNSDLKVSWIKMISNMLGKWRSHMKWMVDGVCENISWVTEVRNSLNVVKISCFQFQALDYGKQCSFRINECFRINWKGLAFRYVLYWLLNARMRRELRYRYLEKKLRGLNQQMLMRSESDINGFAAWYSYKQIRKWDFNWILYHLQRKNRYVINTTLTVVYILIIFIALFVMEHHWKNISWPHGDLNPRRWCQSTDILATWPSHIPKKGVSIPHVAKRDFFNDVPWQIML